MTYKQEVALEWARKHGRFKTKRLRKKLLSNPDCYYHLIYPRFGSTLAAMNTLFRWTYTDGIRQAAQHKNPLLMHIAQNVGTFSPHGTLPLP